jgi:hypothetical protein
MRIGVFLFLALLFCSAARAYAGNIYGTLWLDGRPVPGAQIQITCNTAHTAQTDSNGAYSVSVPEKRRCVFHVDYAGHSGQADVASYDNPIKYDFDLIRQGDGNYVLRSR